VTIDFTRHFLKRKAAPCTEVASCRICGKELTKSWEGVWGHKTLGPSEFRAMLWLCVECFKNDARP